MKNFGIRAVLGCCALLLGTSVALATEHYHTSTLKFVYPLASGDFVIGFDIDSGFCSSASSPKYHYLTVGQNGVTSEGSKKLFAAVLTAVATRQSVTIAFDDATAYCYVNRLTVTN